VLTEIALYCSLEYLHNCVNQLKINRFCLDSHFENVISSLIKLQFPMYIIFFILDGQISLAVFSVGNL